MMRRSRSRSLSENSSCCATIRLHEPNVRGFRLGDESHKVFYIKSLADPQAVLARSISLE